MSNFTKIVEFIRTIYDNQELIPLHEPRFKGNEKKYVEECIDSTFVSSVGRFVNKFEDQIANYTGSKYAVACVNGTAALHTALILAEIQSGDEIITQPLTFVATANAITYVNASPVFIDVDKDTLGLSAEKLKDFLDKNTVKQKSPISESFETINKKTGKRISTCISMHTFGHPNRIDEISEICKSYNITLIEDSAESLGSFYKGKHTGTYGLIGILSFNGNKTITTGGGGMILTNNEKLAKLAKHITTQAKVPHKWSYLHDYIGYNYRLTNIAAALGVAQMEQLSEKIKNKRRLAKKYKTFFDELNIQFVEEPKHAKSNYWLNAILLKDRKERDEFLNFSNDAGVITRPAWNLMNSMKMFNKYQTVNIFNAEWLSERLVNIPSSTTL